jgi:hypothetical protein
MKILLEGLTNEAIRVRFGFAETTVASLNRLLEQIAGADGGDKAKCGDCGNCGICGKCDDCGKCIKCVVDPLNPGDIVSNPIRGVVRKTRQGNAR